MAAPVEKRVRLDTSALLPLIKNERESETGRNLSTQQNPMLISVVLETVFAHCELGDLRRLRLVCKLWHDLLLSRWRNEMIIIISPDHPDSDLSKPSPLRKRLLWKNMNCLYQDSYYAGNPFRRYRLIHWIFYDSLQLDLDANLTRDMYDAFWSVCGPWMMELDDPAIDCREALRKAIVEQTPNLVSLKLSNMDTFTLPQITNLNEMKIQPNLKSLMIRYGVGGWSQVWAPVPPNWKHIPWIELFRHFPNLEQLEWDEIHVTIGRHVIKEWAILTQEAEHSRRKLNFKCGPIEGSGWKNILNTLVINPNFTFSKLHLKMGHMRHYMMLEHWLTLQQNTMETLELSTDGTPINLDTFFNLTSPCLSNLTISACEMSNFHFLKFTPNLTTLSVGKLSFDFSKRTSHENENVHSDRLINLQIRELKGLRNDYDSKAVVEMFVKCMPNMKVFKCPLTKLSFRTVCEHWGGLKVLVDFDYKLDDDTIVGIWPGQRTRSPNITDLKFLKAFETGSILSGKAMWNGILLLEYLTNIEVTLNPRTSDTAFSTLNSKFRTGVRRLKADIEENKRLDEKLEIKAQRLSRKYGFSFTSSKDDPFL